MPDTKTHNSSPEGSDRSPAIGSEPGEDDLLRDSVDDVDQQATSQTDPVKRKQDSPQESEADKAFEKFLNEPTDNPNEDDDDAPPAKAEAPENTPKDEPATSEPAKDDDLNATPGETKDGRVPLKKLSRALAARREAITKADESSKTIDRLLSHFGATEMAPRDVPKFLADVGKARKGDEVARKAILESIGYVPPAAAPTGYSEEEVTAAIEAALHHMDPEVGLDRLRSRRQTQPAKTEAPPAPKPATPAPDRSEAPPAPLPAPRSSYTEDTLRAEVKGMGSALITAFGRERAIELVEQIETNVEEAAQSLALMEVQITPLVMASLYRKAQGSVVKPLGDDRRRMPSKNLRSSQSTPSTRPLTADQQLEAYLAE